MTDFLAPEHDGRLRLRVYLQPGASINKIVGLQGEKGRGVIGRFQVFLVEHGVGPLEKIHVLGFPGQFPEMVVVVSGQVDDGFE